MRAERDLKLITAAINATDAAHDCGCDRKPVDSHAILASIPQEPVSVPDGFVEWLRREMPSGTIIEDPDWWAARISRAMLAAPVVKESLTSHDHGQTCPDSAHHGACGICHSQPDLVSATGG
jgi:hypothetical protein